MAYEMLAVVAAQSIVSGLIGYSQSNKMAIIEKGNNRADYIRRRAQLDYEDNRRRAYNRGVQRMAKETLAELNVQRRELTYQEVVAKLEVQKKAMQESGRISAIQASRGMDSSAIEAVKRQSLAKYESDLKRIEEEADAREYQIVRDMKATKNNEFSNQDRSFGILGSEKESTSNPFIDGLTAGINTFVSSGGVALGVEGLLGNGSSSRKLGVNNG